MCGQPIARCGQPIATCGRVNVTCWRRIQMCWFEIGVCRGSSGRCGRPNGSGGPARSRRGDPDVTCDGLNVGCGSSNVACGSAKDTSGGSAKHVRPIHGSTRGSLMPVVSMTAGFFTRSLMALSHSFGLVMLSGLILECPLKIKTIVRISRGPRNRRYETRGSSLSSPRGTANCFCILRAMRASAWR
jgi:hypothetical protein